MENDFFCLRKNGGTRQGTGFWRRQKKLKCFFIYSMVNSFKQHDYNDYYDNNVLLSQNR